MTLEATNYGYAGMALSLPQVVDNICRMVNSHAGKEEGLDATVREVYFAMADLTTNLAELGKVLRYDNNQRKVHIRQKNHTTYKDFAGIKSVVQKAIETLMNYALVVGQDTLLLLENMWGYLHHLDKEEPDEFAFRLVNDFSKELKQALKE
jgi:hypothetical protein